MNSKKRKNRAALQSARRRSMMILRNKSIALIGGAGFIGSHIVDRLVAERPDNLVVIDDFSLGKDKNLSWAKQEFQEGWNPENS